MEDRAALDHLRYRRILKPMEYLIARFVFYKEARKCGSFLRGGHAGYIARQPESRNDRTLRGCY
jgi:hypothetical protein